MSHPESALLRRVAAIYRAAAARDDGQTCMVAPTPEMQDRINEELEKAQEGVEEMPRAQLQVEPPRRFGFDDGLIIHGTEFPVGTPPSVIRSAAADRAPLRGTVRVIVVLVDFSDGEMSHSKEHFEELFFSLGSLATGSVRDYYQEVTHGLVDLQGEVVGTYRMPRTAVEYAHGKSGIEIGPPNAHEMARDAAEAADPDVNFAPYDNDGNGYVDAFIVVHAGQGAEATLSGNDIWSHKSVFEGTPYVTDGTKVYSYLTVPEDAKTGVCAHELGHLLFGWPDLYDTDNSSSGIGNWCLMAGGSWNGGGDRPAHPSAWCKAQQGWVSVTNRTANGSATFPDVKESHDVTRLWKDGGTSQEYFLVENRQKTGFDDHLPAEGLLIWHIDDAVATNRDEMHPKVALAQADGKRQLEQRVNRGDGGDPYPGSSDNRTFDANSAPGSKSYAGADTCVAVSSISDAGPTMTADLRVRCQKSLREIKEMVKEGKGHWREFHKDRLKELVDTIRWPIELPPHKRLAEGYGRPGRREPFERPLGRSTEELEERLSALEAKLGQPQPFIGRQLRPDLEEGAFAEESDVGEKEQERLEDPFEKRLLDSPPVLG
jgi:immune inhibitor A